MDKPILKQSFAIKSKIESFFTGNKIQISSDGQHLFTACFDVLKILDVSDGRVVNEIKSESEDTIIAFGLSADSNTLVIGYQSGLLRQWLWRPDRQLIRTWKSIHSGPVVAIVCDPTGGLVATGGTDSTIKVWHSAQNYCTHNLRGAQGVISCVHFSPVRSDDSYYIYGAADDYSVHVWDLMTSRHVTKMDGHCSKVTAIRFSLDDEYILTASRDKLVIVWKTSDHQMLRSIPIYESLESIEVIDGRRMSAINPLQADKVFVTAGEKGVLRVWNYGTGDLLYTQQNSLLAVKQESDEPNSESVINSQLITQTLYCEAIEQIVIVSYENNILFHKSSDLSAVKQFVGHMDEVLDIALLGANETHIAIATNSPNIKIFELKTLNCYLLKGHTDIVLSLETYPSDPLTLVSSSKDNVIRVWKFDETLSSAVCQYYGSGHTHSVTAIAVPYLKNQFIVSGSEDTTLKIWKIPKKLPDDCGDNKAIALSAKHTQRAHEKVINAVALSPNDQLIASGSQDKTAKIWATDGLRLLGTMRGHRKSIWCVKFSPVDQVLATSSADATIKIWALVDYSCLKTFEGHDTSVLKVLFIDRGMQMISSGSDGNVKIWNIKDNECVKTLDAHADKVWALALTQQQSANGRTLLITGSSDSAVFIWEDVTADEREETAAKHELQIESEQNLLNYIQKKKWSKALTIAVRLDQPYRALSIMKEILLDSEGADKVAEVLSRLREDQLLSLLEYAIVWNTNSRHYIVAQCVLRAVVRQIPPKELLKTPELKAKVEKLLPYSERHMSRLTRLQQSVTFVDYIWERIKLPEMTLISTKTDAESDDEVISLTDSSADEMVDEIMT